MYELNFYYCIDSYSLGKIVSYGEYATQKESFKVISEFKDLHFINEYRLILKADNIVQATKKGLDVNRAIEKHLKESHNVVEFNRAIEILTNDFKIEIER